MLLCPNEITISDIFNQNTLSPRNFSSIDIVNSRKLSLINFLKNESPFSTGEEPGSFAYVPNSNISFIRNSCIDNLNFSNQVNKEIFLNPKYGYQNQIQEEDVLLCKDANIGETCLFIPDKDKQYILSSGVVKLNFKSEEEKFYCLAFMRDEYFINQLDSMTPRGATIRHAGTKFLQCLIPEITHSERKLIPLLKACIENIAYSERVSFKKLNEANEVIAQEFILENQVYNYPAISVILNSQRLDAGYYSDVVNTIINSLDNYPQGTKTIHEFGFNLKRGPNLAKRDLGRSIFSSEYKKNFHLLVYPSDISDNGYILKETYLGARNTVWYLKSGDILFSAEGTVGKIFVICDEKMKFTTNFHGLIITPNKKNIPLEDSIILGQYLHFLRSYGYFDKVSVGGQGGSFAVNYWEDFRVPNFGKKLRRRVAKLYHSGASLDISRFCLAELDNAGVFELNQFRIKCQEVINMIVKDIKNGKPQEPNHYLSIIN